MVVASFALLPHMHSIVGVFLAAIAWGVDIVCTMRPRRSLEFLAAVVADIGDRSEERLKHPANQ